MLFCVGVYIYIYIYNAASLKLCQNKSVRYKRDDEHISLLSTTI